MLKLQTPVTEEPCKVGISYNDKIMMLGSCFTENIGRQLADYGFDVCVNPFGPLYNPLSVLGGIERLVSGKLFEEEDCVRIGAGDERWCSFYHHTSFAATTKEEFLQKANFSLKTAREHFMASDKLIITLGTSWCFRHIEKGFIVSNCLKHNASEFIRNRLSVNEVTEALSRIDKLCATSEGCKKKQFIFTVSPIRHFKDGAHGNQISKSALLLGIEDFIQNLPADLNPADYFPAYEIMMDELRDYRFYAEDMCHPSSQAIGHIRDRFLNWALPASEHDLLQEKIREFKRSQHIQKHI